jgi:hypothetical protein
VSSSTGQHLSGHDVPLDEGERAQERLDRELAETLEEIRVVLPGVQVLFAFLLAVPFQSGWDRVTDLQRDVYFVSLCLTLLASALLIAPSAYHRSNFRTYDKARLIVLASRLSLFGMASLAASMCGVMHLIADVIFGASTGISAAVAAAVLFLALWLFVPWRDRLAWRRDEG